MRFYKIHKENVEFEKCISILNIKISSHRIFWHYSEKFESCYLKQMTGLNKKRNIEKISKSMKVVSWNISHYTFFFIYIVALLITFNINFFKGKEKRNLMKAMLVASQNIHWSRLSSYVIHLLTSTPHCIDIEKHI